MIGVNIYKSLTWDEVLLFCCDGKKKKGTDVSERVWSA